jgi:anthranilate/para-aminobenzoate synthase component II
MHANMDSPFPATRYHSLIAQNETLPDVFEITSWTEPLESDNQSGEHSNNNTLEIMGIRHKTHPTYGMQYHPESILTTSGMTLLENFLGLSKIFREQGAA